MTLGAGATTDYYQPEGESHATSLARNWVTVATEAVSVIRRATAICGVVGANAARDQMILVVGQLRRGEPEGAGGRRFEQFRFASFGELTRELLTDPGPEMVISHLMGEGFDAIDLARTLSDLGFRGAYRALSPPLPDPRTVRAEVRDAAPDLDFDILILGPQLN